MAQLMKIEHAIKMVRGLKPGQQFEFLLSSVQYPCETMLRRAAWLISDLTGQEVHYKRGCGRCPRHKNSPVHHLIWGEVKEEPVAVHGFFPNLLSFLAFNWLLKNGDPLDIIAK